MKASARFLNSPTLTLTQATAGRMSRERSHIIIPIEFKMFTLPASLLVTLHKWELSQHLLLLSFVFVNKRDANEQL